MPGERRVGTRQGLRPRLGPALAVLLILGWTFASIGGGLRSSPILSESPPVGPDSPPPVFPDAPGPGGDGVVPTDVCGVPAPVGGTVDLEIGPPAASGPVVLGFSPSSGPTTGGTSVLLLGCSFRQVESVAFGDRSADFTVVSDNVIVAVSPPTPEVSEVRLRLGWSGSVSISPGLFEYTSEVAPPPVPDDRCAFLPPDSGPVVFGFDPQFGPADGGTEVVLTGCGFTGVTNVGFGGFCTACRPSFTVLSDREVVVVSPPIYETETARIVVANGDLGQDSQSAQSFAWILDGVPGACAPGTFSSEGVEPCDPAPPGSFVDTEGATSPSICPPGTFSGVAGATACLPAPIGTYVDVEGATGPTTCPSGTTTVGPGATDPELCIPTTTTTTTTTTVPTTTTTVPTTTTTVPPTTTSTTTVPTTTTVPLGPPPSATTIPQSPEVAGVRTVPGPGRSSTTSTGTARPSRPSAGTPATVPTASPPEPDPPVVGVAESAAPAADPPPPSGAPSGGQEDPGSPTVRAVATVASTAVTPAGVALLVLLACCVVLLTSRAWVSSGPDQREPDDERDGPW